MQDKHRINTRNAGEMRDKEITPSRIKHKEISKHINVFYISVLFWPEAPVERILTLYCSILC